MDPEGRPQNSDNDMAMCPESVTKETGLSVPKGNTGGIYGSTIENVENQRNIQTEKNTRATPRVRKSANRDMDDSSGVLSAKKTRADPSGKVSLYPTRNSPTNLNINDHKDYLNTFEDFAGSIKGIMEEMGALQGEIGTVEDDIIKIKKCRRPCAELDQVISSMKPTSATPLLMPRPAQDGCFAISCPCCHGAVAPYPTSISRYHDDSISHPVSIPFALLTSPLSERFQFDLRADDLHYKTLNCLECDVAIHLGCYKEWKSNTCPLYALNYPITFIKDEDLRVRSLLHDPKLALPSGRDPILVTLSQPKSICYPKGALELNTVRCGDCLSSEVARFAHRCRDSIEFGERWITCYRCWQYFERKDVVSIRKEGDCNTVLDKVVNVSLGEIVDQMMILNEIEYDCIGKVWICKSCLQCGYCGSSVPEGTNWAGLKGIDNQWHSLVYPIPLDSPCKKLQSAKADLLFCDECYQAIIRKYMCFLCSRLYDVDNFTIPMIECQSCNAWVHLSCDPVMDLKEYDRMGSKDMAADITYRCKLCRLDDKIQSRAKGDSIPENVARSGSLHKDKKGTNGHIRPPLFEPNESHLAKGGPAASGHHVVQFVKDCLLKWDIDMDIRQSCRLGCLTLLNIGIFLDCHSSKLIIEGQICPLDYVAARWFPSYKEDGVRTLYLCCIRKHTEYQHGKLLVKPKFTIQAMDDPQNTIECFSSQDWTRLWLLCWDCESAALRSMHLFWFFGLRSHFVLERLERMPGLFSNRNYEFKLASRESAHQTAYTLWESSSATARTRTFYPRKCLYLYDKDIEYYMRTFNLDEMMHRWKKDLHARVLLDTGKDLFDLHGGSNLSKKIVTIINPGTFRSTNAFQLNLGLQYQAAKRKFDRNYCGIELKALALMRSAIQGMGVFALDKIPMGTIIIEYKGELVGKKVANEREKYYDENEIGCYFFKLDDCSIIDATVKGNAARFINHSCEVMTVVLCI